MLTEWLILQGIIERGLLFSLCVMSMYLTSRIIKFDDLSLEGSFGLGGAVMALLLFKNIAWWIAFPCVMECGALAGLAVRSRVNAARRRQHGARDRADPRQRSANGLRRPRRFGDSRAAARISCAARRDLGLRKHDAGPTARRPTRWCSCRCRRRGPRSRRLCSA